MSVEEPNFHPDDFWEAKLSELEEKKLREDAWYYSHEKAELQSYLRLMKRLKNERSERAVHFLSIREIKQLRRRFSFMAVSIIAITIFSIYFFVPVKWPQTGARFEVKDPELAFQETQNALLRISAILNEGKEELSRIKRIDELKQEIEKDHE